MANLDCKKPKPCNPKAPVKEIYPPATGAFDVCVGDRTIHWDGTRAMLSRNRHTPDGTYTSVTVVDGCIVGYGYADEPTYTPPYCNPSPSSCQGEGSGGSGGSTSVTISSARGNQLTEAQGGLYARAYVKGGAGVTVTGTGTATDQYTISVASSGGSTPSTVGRNGVEVTKSENGVLYVGLEDKQIRPQTVDVTKSFMVDKYGRITEVNDRTDPIVMAGTGLTTTQQGDTVEIGHEKVQVNANSVLGGFTVTVNDSGHITAISPAINIGAGTYQLGTYDVTVNQRGSITGIAQQTAGLPLRDMAKITVANGRAVSEVYGSPLPISVVDVTVTIGMPSYVVDGNQVNVNGAVASVANFDNGLLTVTAASGQPFTVAFRG